MPKKSLIAIFLLILCVLIFYLGYQNINYKVEKIGGLKVYVFSYSLGNNNGESKYSYSFQLTNTNRKSIFIKNIEPEVNEVIKSKILSKETAVIVNKNLEPNETIQVNGEILVDTKELFMQDIQKLITDIKVSTEEIVEIK